MVPSPRSSRGVGNLPAELTSFVGRRQEVSTVKRLFGTSRLVTLTGAAGVGKTRLALRVGAALRRGFPGGVWFVELAGLQDSKLLTQAVATTLGIHDWKVTDYLDDAQLLLILDNCEHIRDDCGIFAETLLGEAPDVRILATSRQGLGAAGEHLFKVPTLSVPDASAPQKQKALRRYDSVRLFLDRATAANPNFALTRQNFETIVHVCQRLDGLPLAIELTAVRLASMSISEVLDRVNDRFSLLTTGRPGAPPRHQTLRALVDWSSDLCSPKERALWARLSVFSGGFDLAAAEDVCAGRGISRAEVVDLLSALVDKSIVNAEEQAGRTWYLLLETIRQYGQELLRASGEQAFFRQHCEYFDRLIGRAWADWFGPHQEAWLSHLMRQHSNVRSALEFCFSESGDFSAGLRIAGRLWFFWIATGLIGEARRWLDRGLQLEEHPSEDRVRALWVHGYMCVLQGDFAEAKRKAMECHHDADEIESASGSAWAIQVHGMASMAKGDLAEAHACFEEALLEHRSADDLVGILDDCFYLIVVAALRGDLERAELLTEEALDLCDQHGEQWFKSYVLWSLSLVEWENNDLHRLWEAVRESLQLARRLNEQVVVGLCIEILAWNAAVRNEPQRAARLLGGAAGIWRRIGAPLFAIRPLIGYHDQHQAQLRACLGVEQAESASNNGAQMSIQEVIAFALGETAQRSQSRSAGEDGAALTAREMEVAHLIAEGLSNRQIAAKLVIASRTAEGHVEKILRKLCFSSRAQVAAWVVEHRNPELTR